MDQGRASVVQLPLGLVRRPVGAVLPDRLRLAPAMRRLSARQAATCETAQHPRCKCRCGGLLHGRGRISGPEGAQNLPVDDPHFALPKGTPARKAKLMLFQEPLFHLCPGCGRVMSSREWGEQRACNDCAERLGL